jgi:hypothetical protein
MKVKIFKLAAKLIGQKVPTNHDGHAGRYTEKLLEDLGVPINKGHGPDILSLGLDVKSRDLDATRAQNIADMSLEDIFRNPYKQSHVYEKFQQQLRIYTKDNVIISAKVYDFSDSHIQNLIEIAYNHAKAQLISNPYLTRTSYTGGYYGFFERVSPDRKSYSFRLSNTDMIALEAMSTSTYRNLFT